MKILIELPKNAEEIIKRGNWEEGSLFDKVLRSALKNGTIIDDNTNTEKDKYAK